MHEIAPFRLKTPFLQKFVAFFVAFYLQKRVAKPFLKVRALWINCKCEFVTFIRLNIIQRAASGLNGGELTSLESFGGLCFGVRGFGVGFQQGVDLFKVFYSRRRIDLNGRINAIDVIPLHPIQ